MSNNENKDKTSLRRLRRWIIVAIVFLLLAAVGSAMALSFRKNLKESAYDAKDDLKALLGCLAQQDADGAEIKADDLDGDVARMNKVLASPMGRLADHVPLLKNEMNVVHMVSSMLGESSEGLIRPYISLMRDCPLSALKSESGSIDLNTAERYIGFLKEKRSDLRLLAAELDELSDMPYGRLESRLGDMREEMKLLSALIPFGEELTDELLVPTLGMLKTCPLSELKTGDGGINVRMVNRYLDFAGEMIPVVRALLEKLDALGLDEMGLGERLGGFRDKIEALFDLYDKTLKYQPVLRAFMGDGEDKLYVFAAQNASEVRASGGFPGSVGTIRIRDGILRMEDFEPVNNVLAFNGSRATGITSDEVEIFGTWFRAPRDADFCPDYERVAEIWAVAYEEKNGEKVDGVLSATPVIIQKLLAATGEIELADGTVLDGTNAVRMLEYEMYYRYFSYGSNLAEGNEISDALFAETAEEVMDKVTGEIDLSNVAAYLSIVEDCARERTLMLWMKDENEQELVRSAGLDCGLNREPDRPEAGIYFSLTNPSRMGWFMNMNPSVELLEEHEDGSKTYAVHLDMSNVITEAELATASWYITGSGVRGTVTGHLYLFAPAGGSIGKVSCSTKISFFPANYHDLDLQYTHRIYLYPGDSMSVDYTVTTAPCEQEELAISMTPTLQQYR